MNPVAVSLGAGSVAGLVSATLCFPLDLVRRRLQMPVREDRSGSGREGGGGDVPASLRLFV